MCIKRVWKCCGLKFEQSKDGPNLAMSRYFPALLARGEYISYIQGKDPIISLGRWEEVEPQISEVITKFSSHLHSFNVTEYFVAVRKKNSSTWKQAFKDMEAILILCKILGGRSQNV